MRVLNSLQAKAGIGGRRVGVAAVALALGLLGSAPAFADHDGWHHHGRWWGGPRVGVVVGGPPVVYAPPSYYAPPPVVYAPPPVYYAPPPPVVYAPGVSLGVNIR